MKQVTILLLAFLPIVLAAQKCDCSKTFTWLKTTFEANDAGFQYVVNKKGAEVYALHNQIFLEKIKNIDNPIDCQTSIRAWLAFFRKAHLEFHFTGKVDSRSGEEGKEKTNAETASSPIDVPENRLHNLFLNSKKPYAEQLDPKTIYLRIPSFAGNEKQDIDSVIQTNRLQILSTENLIIDIRNGTGGNDDSYEALIPFLYTNPIRMPTVEFRSTQLNNQRMYEMATNTGFALQMGVNPTIEEMAEYKANFDTLSNHLGDFVRLKSADISITTLDTVFLFPKNVGILINHNNVSTDEQFLLEAKQSKKVKLFGTTTKGGLDMSNLYLTFSPEKDFVLVYALSKSLRIPDMAIDDTGIMPDYFMDKTMHEEDWIDFVSKILNE